MGVGGHPWCDIYTQTGLNVQGITFDELFWFNTLLPKLPAFYDNCVAPEIVSPLQPPGIPMRDLSKGNSI